MSREDLLGLVSIVRDVRLTSCWNSPPRRVVKGGLENMVTVSVTVLVTVWQRTPVKLSPPALGVDLNKLHAFRVMVEFKADAD